MKKQQSGFTLIELVVVIVILGILAATAVPRFANLTNNANLAVAQGILGSISSSAAIQLGNNLGAAQTFTTIIGNTDFSNIPANTTITETGAGNGATLTIDTNGTSFGGGPITCTTDPAQITTLEVSVGGQVATGSLSPGLCSG